jgi:hypothetical protein
MTVGTRYHHGDWTPYAAYTTSKATTAGVEAANAASSYGVGLGRMAKLGDVNMNYAVSYWHTTSATEVKGSVIPVEMNFTADAASWLAVRAGFKHDLITRGDKTASTTTSIGSTIHMGKADLDMVVGENNDNAFGFSDEVFANAGLTYRW